MKEVYVTAVFVEEHLVHFGVVSTNVEPININILLISFLDKHLEVKHSLCQSFYMELYVNAVNGIP